jgi:CheY-like chemotaxis protein
MNEQIDETRSAGCELWNDRTADVAVPRRVLIVHAERSVGDAFALLLAMRGFEAVQIGDVPTVLRFALEWRPQVVFVDTRIGSLVSLHDHALMRTLRERARSLARQEGARLDAQLAIAFAEDEQRDPREALQAAGYDGFVRRPCPVWRMFDLLKRLYAG